MVPNIFFVLWIFWHVFSQHFLNHIFHIILTHQYLNTATKRVNLNELHITSFPMTSQTVSRVLTGSKRL